MVAVNDARKRAMARKGRRRLRRPVRGKTIAVLGLTFKPNTDDMREAPRLAIVPALQDSRRQASAPTIPKAWTQASEAACRTSSCRKNPYDCAEGADALVIVTEWDAFPRARLRSAQGS